MIIILTEREWNRLIAHIREAFRTADIIFVQKENSEVLDVVKSRFSNHEEITKDTFDILLAEHLKFEG